MRKDGLSQGSGGLETQSPGDNDLLGRRVVVTFRHGYLGPLRWPGLGNEKSVRSERLDLTRVEEIIGRHYRQLGLRK